MENCDKHSWNTDMHITHVELLKPTLDSDRGYHQCETSVPHTTPLSSHKDRVTENRKCGELA